MSTPQSDQAFQFEGVAFASVESYRAGRYLPAWMNPWRRAARRRALTRLTPALQSGESLYQQNSKPIEFGFTDIVLEDQGDRFKFGWKYTLCLRAADQDEARDHAESFLERDRDIVEYTIHSPES